MTLSQRGLTTVSKHRGQVLGCNMTHKRQKHNFQGRICPITTAYSWSSTGPRPESLQAPQPLLHLLSGILWPHFSFMKQGTCTCHTARVGRLNVTLYRAKGTFSQLNIVSNYYRKCPQQERSATEHVPSMCHSLGLTPPHPPPTATKATQAR